MSKKGQAGALVGIITLLIIFYIIFLPPAEREKLLEPEKGGVTGTNGVVDDVLLDESVGFLSAITDKEVTHTIPNVVLEESSEAAVLEEIVPFIVKKGWIGEQKKTVLFSLKDPDVVQDALLSFSLARKRGVLVISLNEKVIFEGALEVASPAPVVLPSRLLKKNNVLEFEVVGEGFWILPRLYELRDVKVIGDVRETERLEASHLFAVTKSERENLKQGALRFFAVCDEESVGKLTIVMNTREIFSGEPDCGSLNQQEVFKNDVIEGRNAVTFVLSKGAARLEQVSLKNELEKPTPFVQFFEVDKDQNAVLRRGVVRAKLEIEFVDLVSKRAEVHVNAKTFTIDQRDRLFERDVTSALKEGNNFVSLTPLSDLKIVSLKIVLD